jgi:hypothetical protein
MLVHVALHLLVLQFAGYLAQVGGVLGIESAVLR